MKLTGNKISFLAWVVILAVLVLPGVIAAGVSVPYWDSPGNENPLKFVIGDAPKVIEYDLQNLAGFEQKISDVPAVTFTAQIVEGANIAEVIDSADKYLVPGGERATMRVKITLPSDAKVGDRYKVKINFDMTPSDVGMFKSSQERSFDVIVGEKPVVQEQAVPAPVIQETPENNSSTLLITLVVLVLVIAIVILLVKKKRKYR